jgi:hypothetical protein
MSQATSRRSGIVGRYRHMIVIKESFVTKILNETRQFGSLFSKRKKQVRESFKFSIPAGEQFHSYRLTLLESQIGGVAEIDEAPPVGKTGKDQITVSAKYDGLANLKYQIEAFSNRAGFPDSVTKQMTGFLPSRHGWPFANRFVKVPPFKLIGELKYGDASKGLCGGMVYSALDYFVAGLDVPSIPEPDRSKFGSPLQGPIFDYFGKRLFHSFNIPSGVLDYIELMNPNYPDYRTGKSYTGLAKQSRAWRVIRREWPAIKARLDAGYPCPLGLVRVKSTNLSKLGENHQVMAYGYDLAGDELTLFIYDPNFPGNDKVFLKVNIANPERKLNIQYWDEKPVYCFFLTDYTFLMPPGSDTLPGRIILFEDENFCGRSIDIVQRHPDLSAHKSGNFNDCTSSFVILSGNWNFFQNAGFDKPILHDEEALVLGPGSYPRIADHGIRDNEITSLRVLN